MLKEEKYIKDLNKICNACKDCDNEVIHVAADDLLLEIIEKELGYKNFTVAWRKKRDDEIGFWYA